MGNKNDNNNKKHFLNYNIYNHFRYWIFIYRHKFPIIIEDYLGIDMRYVLFRKATSFYLAKQRFFAFQIDTKNLIIENEIDILINWFEKDVIRLDDIIDLKSGQRPIHYAVIMDTGDLVDYLIKNDCNLMARDWNGYTALLKASALGRLELVKKLVEAGVPPYHKDPWGMTPLDKALLFSQHETVNYLKSLPEDLNNEKVEMWRNKGFKEKFNLTPWFMKQF